MGKPFKLKCPWGKATRSYPHYQLAKSIGASSIAPPIECRVYDNSRRSQVRGFTCYRLRKRTCLLADQPHQGQSTNKKNMKYMHKKYRGYTYSNSKQFSNYNTG